MGAISTPTSAYWSGALNPNGSWAAISGAANNTNWLNAPAGTDPHQIPGQISAGVYSDVFFTANTGFVNTANLTTTLDQAFTINSLNFTGSGTGANANNVIINAGSAVGAQAADTLTINAAAGFNTAGTGIVDGSTSGAHTINANVILGGSQTWTNNSTGLLTVGGAINTAGFTLTANGSGNMTLGGVISGGGGLTVNGTGTNLVTIAGSASNSYTGTTTVTSGTLALDNSLGQAITGSGTATTVPAGADIQVNGGTLLWGASNQLNTAGMSTVSINLTSGGEVNLNGFTETIYDFTNSGGTFVTGNNGKLTTTDPTWSGGTNTLNPGSVSNFATLSISGGTNTVQGDMTTGDGGAVLNVGSSGGLTFSGTGSPTLTINSDAASAGQVVLQGNITANSNSNGSIVEGGSAAFLGTLDLGGATRSVSTASGSTLTIAVPITGSNGLTKTGPGTLVLSANNTYTGKTTVNAGKVVVSGKLLGRVDVSANDTLASGNNITSQVAALNAFSTSTVGQQGGTVAPGDSGGSGLTTIGQLNVTGSVSLGTLHSDSGVAHLSIEIGGIQDGSGVGSGGPNTTSSLSLEYDRIAMGATLSLQDASLDITPVAGYTFSLPSFNNSTQQFNLDGHIFFLITGASSVSGAFTNDSGVVDQNVPGLFTTLSSNGQLFAISYDANFTMGTFTGGNDVAVMAIPEPNSMSMLAGSLGLALGLQRFRRRRRASSSSL